MSYLGSIGSVMVGSGLQEAVAVCCGSNTVNHMLSGKAISCAVREFFLVDGALSVLLLENLMPDAYALADPWGGAKGVIVPPPDDLQNLLPDTIFGLRQRPWLCPRPH